MIHRITYNMKWRTIINAVILSCFFSLGASRVLIAGVSTGPDIRIAPLSIDFSQSSNPEIYVEIDWMETGTHSHKPSQAVVDRIIDTFAREGFTIHIDVSNVIPHQDVLPVSQSGPSASAAVLAIRNQYFNHALDSRYYYSIWGHDYSLNGVNTHSSGIADLPGGIHLVTLGSFPGQVGTFSHQVGTFVHEFGHNLAQRHGGGDHANYKPNYVSVMNYFFQLQGVGPTLLALGLANNSSGFNDFGYSHGTLPSLNENDLDENTGIGLNRAVDWNCNGVSTNTHIAKDLQNSSWCSANGSLSVISDFHNWNDIVNNIQDRKLSPHSQSEPVEPCITWEEYQRLQTFIATSQAERGEPQTIDESTTTPVHAFVVSNDGGSDLIVNGISPETAAAWISWSPPIPFTVHPGASQTVTVSVNYSMAPPGQTTRRLLISSNDADENPYPAGVYVNSTVLAATPTPSPTPTATATVPPTPTPPPITISGTLAYCSNPSPGPIPNVTLTLTGTTSGSTLTNGSGSYLFSSLPSGGSYTITPTKASLTPGGAGPRINTIDMIAIQRHFLQIAFLSGCRLIAADVNGDAVGSTVDVIAIQRFFNGEATGIANVGQYIFIPANRTYSGVSGNQTNQNYDSFVLGDVASPFAE